MEQQPVRHIQSFVVGRLEVRRSIIRVRIRLLRVDCSRKKETP